MTEALANAPPSLALARALEVLAEASPTTDEQLQAVLHAIQEVGQLPTGSCLPFTAFGLKRQRALGSKLLPHSPSPCRHALD